MIPSPASRFSTEGSTEPSTIPSRQLPVCFCILSGPKRGSQAHIGRNGPSCKRIAPHENCRLPARRCAAESCLWLFGASQAFGRFLGDGGAESPGAGFRRYAFHLSSIVNLAVAARDFASSPVIVQPGGRLSPVGGLPMRI